MEIFGWGKKNTVDVNKKGQMLTFAEAIGPGYDAALRGEAFTMDIDGIQPDAVDYWLLVIKNGHSTLDLVVEYIYGWAPSFSNTQIYEAVIGQTFVFLDNGNAVVPVNKKSGLTGGAQGLFYVNDGSGNMTTIGGTGLIVCRHIFGAETGRWDLGIVVPPAQTFMVRSDLAEKLTGSVHFFYRD